MWFDLEFVKNDFNMEIGKYIKNIVFLLLLTFTDVIKGLQGEIISQKITNNSQPTVCPTLNALLSSFHYPDLFSAHNDGGDSHKIEKLTPTSELKICSSFSTPNATCCSKEAEEILMNQSIRRFRQALSSQFQPLKQILSDFREKIKGLILNEMEASKRLIVKRLRAEFGSPRFAETAQRLIPPLADDADVFNYTRADVMVAIFPAIFSHVLGTGGNDSAPFEASFEACLSEGVWPTLEQRLGNQLIGHVTNMAAPVVDVLTQAGLTFLSGLGLAPLSPDCGWSLTKMYHCQACALDLVHDETEHGRNGSEVSVSEPILENAPEPALICKGLCWNVARGCLAHLDRAGVAWLLYIKQIKNILLGLGSPHSDKRKPMDQTIADIVMWALENGPALNLNVTKMCGQLRMAKDYPKNGTSPKASSISSTHTASTQHFNLYNEAAPIHLPSSADHYISSASLQTVVEDFVKELETKWDALNNGRPSFSFIPDQICSTDQDVSASNKNCWDGDLIGRYSRNIVKFGVNSLRNNPEILESDTQGDEQLSTIVQSIKELRSWLEKYQRKFTTISTPSSSSAEITESVGINFRVINEVGRLVDDTHISSQALSGGTSNRRSVAQSGPEDQDGGASGHVPDYKSWGSNQKGGTRRPSDSLEDDEDISSRGSGHFRSAPTSIHTPYDEDGALGSGKAIEQNKPANTWGPGLPREETVTNVRNGDIRKPYDFKDDTDYQYNNGKMPKSPQSSAPPFRRCNVVVLIISLLTSWPFLIYSVTRL